MKKRSSPSHGDRRGIAAVEFALIAPLLLLLLGGVADFGLMMVGKGQLANGLAQGVQYALLKGPSVSGATIQSVVKSAAAQSGVKPMVTVSTTDPVTKAATPACYCVLSNNPATLKPPPSAMTASYTCGGSCTSISPSSVAPGVFLIITASYTYSPLMPFYKKFASTTVSETVTVRVQ